MNSRIPLSRRAVLKGLGVTMALPWLEVMSPLRNLGSVAGAATTSGTQTGPLAAAAAAAAGKPPVRMGFIAFPNGVSVGHWMPSVTGTDFELPQSLEPLKRVKDELLVISGLAQRNANSLGAGPGDHARSSAALLTSAHPYKTAGSNIRVGTSVDQYAAQQIGRLTRLPSLELGCDRGRDAGNCDSGYACAYVNNISWRDETTPAPKEVDPGAVFDRLFGTEDERKDAALRARRLAMRQSILDAVRDDTRRLENQISQRDRHTLDQFNTSVREIEQRIQRIRAEEREPNEIDYDRPTGIPRDFGDHVKLMGDMMILAFRMDLTRICSFLIAREGSNRNYRQIGISDGHHYLSHHRNNTEMVNKVAKIDRYHVELFAYIIEQMKQTPEGDGTLLDNTMLMVGSGISCGNRHNHYDLPILLAGRGGGAFTPGRHVRYPKYTPLSNLFLNMLDQMQIPTEEFGDSTGRLTDLA